MEHATKALLIAGGVLIGIMILSLGVALFAEMNSYVETSNERVLRNNLNQFNRQFFIYLNSTDLKIQDIVTAANFAYENNENNNLSSDLRGNINEQYIAVYLDGNPIEHNINEEVSKLLTDNLEKTYKCKHVDGNDKTGIKISDVTGRVYEIYFYEK